MRKLFPILRFIVKNKYTYLLNFFGVTLGLTSVIIIGVTVRQEYNYDSSGIHSGNIYRVVSKTDHGKDPSTPKMLAQTIAAEIPEIRRSFKFYSWYGYLACSHGEQHFTEKNVIFTDSTFFETLDISMIYGEKHVTTLDKNSVLISGKAAQKYFGDKDPVGETFKIGESHLFKITGVFEDFPRESNFKGELILDISIVHWLTQVYFPDEWEYNTEISTFVLLNETADLEAVVQKIHQVYANNVAEDVPEIELQKLANIHLNKDIIWESTPQIEVNYLYFLMLGAAMILLMSMANFIILYISTATKRTLSTLIRKVYGARKGNLFGDYVKEIYLILVFALFFSLMAIWLISQGLSEYFTFFPESEAIFSQENLKLLGILVLILAICGVIPALYLVSKVQARSIHKEITGKKRRAGMMNYLIIVQFALCTFLIVSNLVIQKQLSFMESYDPGYQGEELVTIPINMHIGEGIYGDRLEPFCDEIKKGPGIRNMTLGFSSPALVLTSRDDAEWEGKTGDKKGVTFCWNSVYFDYFETLGIHVIKGRSFNRQFSNDFTDYDKGTTNYVLNQTAVREMGLSDPIGKSFEQHGFKGQIVGVVEDFHFRSLHDQIFPMAFSMNPFFYNEIIVRIDPGNASAIDHIKQTWKEFMPDKAIEISFVDDQLSENYRSEQNLASILNIFFVVAMFIAIIGLITLTISSTQMRIKEIGIRKVNGASIVQILIMLNRDYLKWVTMGFLVISPVVWVVMNKWLQGFAFRISMDIRIFIGVGLLVFALAAVTVSFQSLSAALTNPVKSLKYE